jgi:ABC-type lipoprotein release transport system permease subunit
VVLRLVGLRLLVAAGIAAGVMPVVAIEVVNDSVLASLRDTMVRLSGAATLEVTQGFGEQPFPALLLGMVAGQKEVSAAMPLVRGTVALADDPGDTLQLVGLALSGKTDLDLSQARLSRHRGDVGTWSSEPQSIVLPTTLARRLGADIGGSIRLSTPRGTETFTVRGLLEPEGFARAFGGRLAVMDLAAAQDVLGKRKRLDQIDVLVKPDADGEALRGHLKSRLPQVLSVERPGERARLYEAALRPFQALLTGLGLLCLAAGVYVAYSAASAGATRGALHVAERRTAAAPSAQPFRLPMVEALMLGAIGTALGVASGMAVAPWCIGPVSDALATVFQIGFPVVELSVDPRRLVEVAILGIVATVFASSIAGRAAASLGRRDVARAAADPVAAPRRFPIRTGSTIAAIAIVTTVAVALASVLLSRRESLNRYYDDGGLLAGDLVVSAVASDGGWLEIPLLEQLGDELRAIPGVRAVDTVRAIPSQLYRGRRITVLGLSDGLLDPSRYGPQWYVDGDHRRAAAPLRRGVSANLAVALSERFGLHLGDSIELDTPAGPFPLPIAGIVRDYFSELGTVVVGRRLLIGLWDEPTVQRFSVFVQDGASVEAVRLGIARRLGDRHLLKVLTPGEVADHQSRLLDHAFAFTDAMQLLIVVVTFAGLFDLLLATVVEGPARRTMVVRSVAVGALGALLGTAAGLLTAWVAVRRLHLEWHVALAASAWYVALVLGTALLTGYLVSRRVQAVRTS